MDVQNKSTKKTKELKANAKQIIKTIFELNYVVGKLGNFFYKCVVSSTFLVTYATEGRWLLSDRKGWGLGHKEGRVSAGRVTK